MKTENRQSGRLSSFPIVLRRLCRESMLGGILTSGDSDYLMKRSGVADKIRYGFVIPAKRTLRTACDRSRLVGFGEKALGSVRNLPLRSVGIVYFTFGIFTLFMFLLERIILRTELASDEYIYGLICLILSGIAMTSAQRIGELLSGGAILPFISDRLLIDDRQVAVRTESVRPPHVGTLIFSGIFLGAVAQLTSFSFAALLPVFAVAALKTLKQPSFGLLLLLTASPFLQREELAVVAFYVFISTVFKLMTGKRDILLSFSGIVTVVIIALVIISGIREGIGYALEYASVLLMFFTVSALFKTEKRIERLVFCLAVPGVVLSAMTLMSVLLTLFNSIPWLPTFSSVMPDGSVITSLVCVSIPMTVVCADITYVRDLKLTCFFIVMGELAALFFSAGSVALFTGIALYGFTLITIYQKAAGPVLTVVLLYVAINVFFDGRFFSLQSGMSVLDQLTKRLPLSVMIFGGGAGADAAYTRISSMTGIQIPQGGIDGVSAIILSIGLLGALFAAMLAAACVLNALKLSIAENVAGEHRVIAAGCASAVVGWIIFSLQFCPVSSLSGLSVMICCVAACKAVDEFSNTKRFSEIKEY